ncbi:MAG: hypothetical protein AAF368_00145 [Planctomycetota bacterium]
MKPWESEPDRWVGTCRGFELVALRHSGLGHWCGYLCIPEGHPLHGRDLESDDLGPDIHGGWTWARSYLPNKKDASDGWWVGFDCAHSGDLQPGGRWRTKPTPFANNSTYKTLNFVKSELFRACAELEEALG